MDTLIHLNFENGRFRKYETNSTAKIEVLEIFPAKEEDLSKYLLKKRKVLETFDMYKTLVLPKIINQNLDWIDNIVNNNKEKESILYQCKDFVFLPDLKWDKNDTESLYYLAIVKHKELRSIRDLNNNHIEMLKQMYEICVNILCNKYKRNKEDFRVYFHYPPSFWQLHIHFNLISKKWAGALIDYSHPLSSVINNIELVGNYYQKAKIEVITQ